MGRTQFSRNLKALRQFYGMSQEGLADAIGVARSTISSYERGVNEPDWGTVNILANYFGITEKNLMEGQGYESLKGNFKIKEMLNKNIFSTKFPLVISEEAKKNKHFIEG